MAKNTTKDDEKKARRRELFSALREDNERIDEAVAAVGAAQAERRKTITAMATDLNLKAIEVDGDRFRIRKVKDSDPVEYDLQPVKALDFASDED